MPKSEIQKHRRKLNTVRRAHGGDPVITSLTKIVRSQLDLVDKGDTRMELMVRLKGSLAELEKAIKATTN